MYRRTRKAAEARERRIRAMLEGKAAARMARPTPACPAELPQLRMRITVERLDFGREQHVIELHRTRRVDVYAVTIDGRPWISGARRASALDPPVGRNARKETYETEN